MLERYVWPAGGCLPAHIIQNERGTEKMGKTMKALVYDKAGRENSSIRQIPYPECGDDEIIIRVMSCSICKGAEHDHDNGKGTDLARYPVVPGHEFAGYVHETGKMLQISGSGTG